MAKLRGQFPLGNEKINVAAQRSVPNIREAENVGEQASTLAQRYKNDVPRFSKHGTFFGKATTDHPIQDAWE
jgi:hypothetical protein